MVNLEGKKVLVTGGTGFVGCRLVERLHLECRADVRALVHRWASAAWVARLPVDLVQCDINDNEAVREAVSGCDIVFHCASGGNGYDGTKTVIAGGTKAALEASRIHGVSRFVHVSSLVVHDMGRSGLISEESSYFPCGRGYNDAKILAEKWVFDYHRKYGLPVSIVRPTFVWGPRGGQFSIGPVRAIKAKQFALLDNGSAECPAVYVDNLVDALILAATRPEAVGEAFLVTDGNGRTWGDFFNAYATMLGINTLPSRSTGQKWVSQLARLGDRIDTALETLNINPAPLWRRLVRRSLREFRQSITRLGIPTYWYMQLYSRKGGVSIDKARRALGYRPRIDLDQGMAETEIWLKDQFPDIMGGD